MTDEERYAELMIWQDILDQVINGRLDGHMCPFCHESTVKAEADEAYVKVVCEGCGKWFEGYLK